MDKKELLELLKEEADFQTKKEAGEFLEKLDLVFEVIAGALETDAKVRVGSYFTLEKKNIKAKTGEINGKPYSKEAREEIKIKKSSLLKKLV